MGTRRRPVRIGMHTIRSLARFSAWRRVMHRQGVTIALVPTMGALHEGHRSLIRKARLTCDAVVVSLFVNPRQFGKGEDFGQYPRRFARDAALCRREGVDVLFAPSRAAMYPPDCSTTVEVHNLSRRWEGEFRPGHFEGMATIVTKLISWISPDDTFFGQKDYQQAIVVRRLVEDLNLGTRVVVCPTVREADGLAASSRNEYLSRRQRLAAPVLNGALQAGAAAIRSGARRASEIERAMVKVIKTEPLARIDYLTVCDPETLERISRVEDRGVLLAAIRIAGVRLIDNLLVRVPRRTTPGRGTS